MSKVITKYDKNNNLIYYKDSNGFEVWREYNEENNCIHYKDSNGIENYYKYDKNNNNLTVITKQEFEEQKNKEEMIIIIEGGLIQEIKTLDNFNMKIKIRDYDVEGAEDDEVITDEEGKEHYEYIY